MNCGFRILQNEANFTGRQGPGRRDAQNEPNFRRAGRDEGANTQNEPNLPDGAGRDGAWRTWDGGNYAKRTQLPRGGVGQGRPTLDQVEGGLHQEAIMQNKAKFGQTGVFGG